MLNNVYRKQKCLLGFPDEVSVFPLVRVRWFTF